MLITFSGMVGSGKSTAARHVAGLFASGGVPSRYLRFRSLAVLPFTSPSDASGARRPAAAAPASPRASGFRLRRLTAATTCGYLVRIVAFRVLGPSRTSSEWTVLDRYFYDSFVHYELGTWRERLYAAVLRRVMPVPDIAVLLVASSETIAERRPDYAREYISLATRGYARLRTMFPELVEIRTDPGEAMLERLDALVYDWVLKSGVKQRV